MRMSQRMEMERVDARLHVTVTTDGDALVHACVHARPTRYADVSGKTLDQWTCHVHRHVRSDVRGTYLGNANGIIHDPVMHRVRVTWSGKALVQARRTTRTAALFDAHVVRLRDT
jgi:hypothetical protein